MRSVREWKAAGYKVEVPFLQLDRAETVIGRVALHVAQGGHSIPEDVIRRRFAAGKENFERPYASIVDEWGPYDASGGTPIVPTRRR